MTKDEEKIYLSSINKIIKSGNPKFLSYISKEYMKFKDINPEITLAITCMIQKEATEDSSVYGIFLNNNGTINIEAMSDISKISNVNEFVGTINELSEFNIDFSDLTADDLIKEGEVIAEELAREAESIASEIDSLNVEENTEILNERSNSIQKADDITRKVGVLVTIGGLSSTILNKIRDIMSRITRSFMRKKNEKQSIIEENKKEQVKNESENKTQKDESFCPIVNIDVKKAVEDKARSVEEELERKRLAKEKGVTTDDDIDDNPADDFLDF